MKGIKITWTDKMIAILKEKFHNHFTRDILDELGVSKRSAIRKARELGLNKDEGFLDTNRAEITALATGGPSSSSRKLKEGPRYQWRPISIQERSKGKPPDHSESRTE